MLALKILFLFSAMVNRFSIKCTGKYPSLVEADKMVTECQRNLNDNLKKASSVHQQERDCKYDETLAGFLYRL